MQWQGIQIPSKKCQEVIEWMMQKAKGRSARAEVFRMVLAAAVYYCWHERNSAVFQKGRRPVKAILRSIIQEVHVRASRSAS